VFGSPCDNHLAGANVDAAEELVVSFADVVVQAPLGNAGLHRQHRGRPIKRFDLGLLSTHNTAAASDGLRYSPTMSRNLLDETVGSGKT
jgi:hypothetical protein